jgi:hypothetical protein
MMQNLKNKAVSAKNKISENKTKILGTALVVTTTAAVLLKIGNAQMNNFLKEKGLYDEYWAMDELNEEN